MNTNYPPFIQFVGTQRSGSNLLRVMLNQLSEISAPHPPHILKTFFPLLSNYGNLNNHQNFVRLVEDVCEWVNINPVPWGLIMHPKIILNLCKENSLVEVFVRIYEYKAIHDKALYACCKSMESVYYFNEIELSGLSPTYVHIYRDGRDVALSFTKAIVGPKHIYFLAKKWLEEQQLSFEIRKRVGDERFISIRYEDLLKHPAETMKYFCAKLKVKFTEEIFDYFNSSESKSTAQSGNMWKNLTKPIMTDNSRKYLSELSLEQIKIFESVAGGMLEILEYKREFPSKALYKEFDAALIENFQLEDKRLANLAIQKAGDVDAMKRKPQEEFLKRIQKLNGVVYEK